MAVARRVLGLSALCALMVVGAPTIGGAQAPTVTSVIGSADGLFAELEVSGPNVIVPAQQPLNFGPAPSVTLPPEGGSVSDEILDVEVPVDPVSLNASLVSVSAEGALGEDGFATATSSVLDLLLAIELPNLPASELGSEDEVDVQQLAEPVVAEAISATCEADLDGVSGSTTLLGASVLDTPLEEEPEPNTEIDIPFNGIGASVLLNGQDVNPDGSLTVIPLAIFLSLGIVEGVIAVGPVTCGVVEGAELEEIVPAPSDLVPAEPLRAAPRFTG